MALIRCPDCGTEVSEAAPACVKCGRPLAALNTNRNSDAIAGLASFVLPGLGDILRGRTARGVQWLLLAAMWWFGPGFLVGSYYGAGGSNPVFLIAYAYLWYIPPLLVHIAAARAAALAKFRTASAVMPAPRGLTGSQAARRLIFLLSLLLLALLVYAWSQP